MSDSISEQEPKVKERIIRLNEEFTPWDPMFTETRRYEDNPGHPCLRLSSDIYIGLTEKLKIPFAFSSAYSKSTLETTITPFHRQNGYQIDARDLDPKKRQEKYEHMSESHRFIDDKLDPNWLRIESNEYNLEQAGINKKVNLRHILSPEMLSLFSRLRLKLKFPGSPNGIKPESLDFFSESTYESKPSDTLLSLGGIGFRNFYPSDTGSLQPVGLFNSEGFSIFTPASLDVLKTIKAEFYLAEEEKEEQTLIEPTPTQQPSAEYILPLGVKRK